MKNLHITNGDIAAHLIRSVTNDKDDVIAWQDVLFEGPVPDLSLNKLSELRARYLSDSGYGDLTSISAEFVARNSKIEKYADYKEVILWFEHDVYDQLQLIQILDWFSKQKPLAKHLKLISIGSHPKLERFLGFGQLSVDDMGQLLPSAHAVETKTLQLGKTAWQAFSDVDPQPLLHLIKSDLSALPFLKNAFIRLLEEYPSVLNGLSRTEQYILASVKRGQTKLLKIFEEMPMDEGNFFMGMGDVSFWAILKRLATSKNPLVTFSSLDQQHQADINFIFNNLQIHLTRLGEEVSSGEKNWIAMNGINRWVGGVHLTEDRFWCWDKKQQKLVTP